MQIQLSNLYAPLTMAWQRLMTGMLSVVLSLGIAVGVGLTGCSDSSEQTPEIRLQNWLTQMETAVKEKKLSEIKALISPDYQDAQGNTRQAVMLKLRFWFQRYDNIGLSNSVNEVEVMSAETARMVVETQFSQSQLFAQMGMSENRYQFVLLFEADGDDWLLNSVSYTPQ